MVIWMRMILEASSRACKMTALEVYTRNKCIGDGEMGKGLVALHTIVLLLYLYYKHYTAILLG